jgi:hypothetical protein
LPLRSQLVGPTNKCVVRVSAVHKDNRAVCIRKVVSCGIRNRPREAAKPKILESDHTWTTKEPGATPGGPLASARIVAGLGTSEPGLTAPGAYCFLSRGVAGAATWTARGMLLDRLHVFTALCHWSWILAASWEISVYTAIKRATCAAVRSTRWSATFAQPAGRASLPPPAPHPVPSAWPLGGAAWPASGRGGRTGPRRGAGRTWQSNRPWRLGPTRGQNAPAAREEREGENERERGRERERTREKTAAG